MGIPYSRQINAAFEQVTPLVAAGFKVLRTTRDISILLAVIQVLTVALLGLILLGLVALLYSVNPDLEVRKRNPTYKSSINDKGACANSCVMNFSTSANTWLRHGYNQSRGSRCGALSRVL
jgi:hypothetical protein